jgi:hypothetical protein
MNWLYLPIFAAFLDLANPPEQQKNFKTYKAYINESGISEECNTAPYTLNFFCPNISTVSTAIYSSASANDFAIPINGVQTGIWKVYNVGQLTLNVQYGTIYSDLSFNGVWQNYDINTPFYCWYQGTGVMIAIYPTWSSLCIGYPMIQDAFWTYSYFLVENGNIVSTCFGGGNSKNCPIQGRYCVLNSLSGITSANWPYFSC